jgi:hypothetical protein
MSAAGRGLSATSSLRGAQATKQSRLFRRQNSGLLRFARNDEEKENAGFAPAFSFDSV